MTLDESLVQSVDRVVKKMHTTRSAFARDHETTQSPTAQDREAPPDLRER